MQNSNNMVNKPAHREVIPTNESAQENRYFFVTFICVIWLAALLLWFISHDKQTTTRLPNHLSNLATQLSIASDEITMLQDMELLPSAPSLGDLVENQIVPFNAETISMPKSNCFVIEKQNITLRLIKLGTNPWQVQWQGHTGLHDSHANSHVTESDEHLTDTHEHEYCSADEHWLAVSHLANN